MTPALSGGARRRPPGLLRWLERLAILVVSLAIAVGVIALLSGGLLAGRDNPGLYGPGGQLGVHLRDQGDGTLATGARAPAYDSVPPTSGAHRPVAVTRAGATLNDNQLLTALAAGNVVLMYGTPRPPAGLSAMAASVAAPFSPALARAGQAVILARRPAIPGVLAVAWTRLLHVGSATDPRLRSFTVAFLGHGAGSG